MLHDDLNISISESSAICGVHYMTYYKWVSGSQSPPAVALRLFDIVSWLHRYYPDIYDRMITDIVNPSC